MSQDKVSFIPETQDWFNIYKSLSIMKNIDKIEDRIYMIISTDVEKVFIIDYFLKSSKDKSSKETGNNRMISQHGKLHTANL